MPLPLLFIGIAVASGMFGVGGTVKAGFDAKNAKQINWNKATSRWQQAKGMGLFTAEVGGDPFYYCKLDTPLDVEPNAVALFDPGELCISMAKKDVSTATTTTDEASE